MPIGRKQQVGSLSGDGGGTALAYHGLLWFACRYKAMHTAVRSSSGGAPHEPRPGAQLAPPWNPALMLGINYLQSTLPRKGSTAAPAMEIGHGESTLPSP
jgi:hypothetical protein